MPDDDKPKLTPEELRAVRMANIEGHKFKQGESGNPNGRPKGKSVAAEIKRMVEEADGDVAVALASVAMKKALKGDYRYWNAIFEILDGPRSRGGVNITGNQIQIAFVDLEPPPGYTIPEPPDELRDLPDMPSA